MNHDGKIISKDHAPGAVVGTIVGTGVGTVVICVTVVVGTVVTTVVMRVIGITPLPGVSRLETVALAFLLISKFASNSSYPTSFRTTPWLPTGIVMIIGVTAPVGVPSRMIWAP